MFFKPQVHCTHSAIAVSLVICFGLAKVAAAVPDDQERAAQEEAAQAELQAFQERIAAARAQQMQALRARQQAERTAAEAVAERDRAIRAAEADVARLKEEVAKAEAAYKAAMSEDDRSATRPSERVAPKATEAFKQVEDERAKLLEAIGAASRPATKPADDLKDQVKRNIAEIDTLRAENARQKREIAELNKKLADEAWMHPILPLPPQQNGPQPPNDLLLRSGTIKARKNINGIEYATVSLGEKEHVQKGMKLRVMNGDVLLGHLIIDLVESDESVGHLEGKTIDQVKPGCVVRPFPH